MKGVYTAIVTPFNNDLSVDFEALGRLIDRQKEAGVSGLIVGGTTGEAATLSLEEKEELYAFVKERAEGLDLVVGTGTNSTADSVKQTERVLKLGIEKVLIVTPYYNKPNLSGLYEHYRQIAETGAKIVLYNVPGRTGLNVSVDALKHLAAIDGIVAVKEASGSMHQLIDYLEAVGMDRFEFMSGDDFTIAPFIALGGRGVISVLSNVLPEKTVELVSAALDGDMKKATELQTEVQALNRALFIETNPVPVKTLLSMMRLIKEKFRPPLGVMNEGNKSRLASVAKDYGLL